MTWTKALAAILGGGFGTAIGTIIVYYTGLTNNAVVSGAVMTIITGIVGGLAVYFAPANATSTATAGK